MLSNKLAQLRFCVVAGLLLATCTLAAQENCANGIDDDGDGLVDLNDLADCSCSLPSTTFSLLPNPSLESFSSDQDGCESRQPGGLPDATNQANCLVGWQRVSLGTTDAWNAFTLPGAPPSFPASLPQPLPSGTGVAGFWVGIKDVFGSQFRNGNGTTARHYREYLAACLVEDNRLVPNRDYRLTFSLGFMKPQKLTLAYSSSTVDLASPDSIELAIYGVRECGQLNFGEFYDCPEASGAAGYELITTTKVSGTPGSWTAATIDFTCTGEYEGFAIGGSCAEDIGRPDGGRYRNYYFIDDLILNQEEAFEAPVAGPVSVSGQTVCAEEIVLTGKSAAGANYQWYQDGIALSGATGIAYRVNPSLGVDGAYSLRITTPGGCALTEPVNIQRPIVYDQVPDSVALCGGGREQTIYPVETGGASYSWSDGSSGASFTISEPGTYSVTVSTACVQREETFVATDTEAATYRYRVTPENPCYGDTVEVVLQTNWYAPLTVYFLPNGEQVYANGIEPIRVVAGEVEQLQALYVGSCGIVSELITIPVRAKMEVNASILDLNCQGATGKIDLRLPEAITADIQWFGPEGNEVGKGPSIETNYAGRYTSVITHPQFCTTQSSHTVSDNNGFDLKIEAGDVTCGADGSAVALAVGGSPPYTYNWMKHTDAPPIGTNAPVVENLDRGTFVARLTDSKGCKTEETFTVRGPDPLRANVTTGWTVCHVDTAGTITLAASGGTLPYRYGLISGGREQSGATITGLSAGEESVYVTDASGCVTETISVPVVLPRTFSIDAGEDRTVSWGETVQLNLTLDGIAATEGEVEWSPAEGLTYPGTPFSKLSASATPAGKTVYRARFTSNEGCSRSDSVTVSVENGSRIYAPSAFSPNGDGVNDHFQFFGNSMITEVIDLKIFDRWGGLVWVKTAEAAAMWDGSGKGLPLGTGIYVYHGTVLLRDNSRKELTGSITLLR